MTTERIPFFSLSGEMETIVGIEKVSLAEVDRHFEE